MHFLEVKIELSAVFEIGLFLVVFLCCFLENFATAPLTAHSRKCLSFWPPIAYLIFQILSAEIFSVPKDHRQLQF